MSPVTKFAAPKKRRAGVGLEAEEERALAIRWRTRGDRRARDRLVETHVGLARHIAREYRHDSYEELQDLTSAALEGLVRAVDHYDPDKGTRLTTYSAFWIRALILKHSLELRGPVFFTKRRVEREVFWGLRRAREAITNRGEAVNVAAIAKELHAPEDVVHGIMTVTGKGGVVHFVDGATNHGEAFKHRSVAYQETPESLFGEAEEESCERRALHRAVQELRPDRRRVVEGHLAGKSFADMAREVGVCRERIRQIYGAALKQLRKRCLNGRRSIGRAT